MHLKYQVIGTDSVDALCPGDQAAGPLCAGPCRPFQGADTAALLALLGCARVRVCVFRLLPVSAVFLSSREHD